MMRRFLLSLGLLTFGTSVSAYPGAIEGWKLESDIEGVRVYSRAVEGSPFRQIRAVASVAATFDRVLGILVDYGGYHHWMSNITESQVMHKVSETVHYVYTYEDAPWPVQNRFCVSRMTLLQERDRATLKFESVPRFMESPRDAIEVASYKGYWRLDKGKTGCDIEYFLEVNPGGHVPTWLANQMAYGAPSKTVRNLRKRAERQVLP